MPFAARASPDPAAAAEIAHPDDDSDEPPLPLPVSAPVAAALIDHVTEDFPCRSDADIGTNCSPDILCTCVNGVRTRRAKLESKQVGQL